MGTHAHKSQAPRHVKVGILSISTTRSLDEDQSGHWIRKRALKEGHQVVSHQVIDDDIGAIRETTLALIAEHQPQILLLTGGTGVSSRDVTIEAVQPLFTKELTSFAPIFAQLSYEQIDSAAIISRATAGVVGKTALFCMPGSLKACQLACKALIFPEVGHLAHHLAESG